MSSILVIGGTGFAGRNIVAEAAHRGHQVTSVSRKVPAETLDGVTYRTGDLTVEVPDLDGFDVVVAALSPRGSNAGELRAAYAGLAGAVAAAGARLVVIGGYSSLRPAEGQPRFADAGQVPAEFAAEAHEMNAIMEDLLASSTVGDWVFVSPAAVFGAHAPGTRIGHHRTSGEVALAGEDGASTISGEDFGAAVVDEIERPSVRGGQISFAA